MVHFDEVFKRIQRATNTRTQVELAEILDIRQSSISDAKRRNSIPADWFMKLFEQFGLNPDWLKKGSGPMYLRTEQGYTPVDAPAGVVCEDVGVYNGPDSKNHIVSVHSTESLPGGDNSVPVLGRLSIPQSFACPSLYVVRVDSSGMEPQIRKGAFVGIDMEKCHVSSGELYAVRLPYEGLVIKRAYMDSQNGLLVLRSDNKEYPELSVPLEGYEAHIAGKVIWIMQHM